MKTFDKSSDDKTCCCWYKLEADNKKINKLKTHKGTYKVQ